MKSLDKRIFRNLKSNIGKYIAIFILLTATMAFGSAFLCVADSVDKNLKDNQKTCNIEDGNFTLQEKYDFSASKYEIEDNFYINLENNYTLRVYKIRENINKLSLFEGKIPTNENDIAIDRAFANSNNIKMNDKIEIQKSTFNVVGIISAPDYNSLFKNNNDLVMNTFDFGIGFVNEETFSRLENDYNTNYNYSYKGNNDEVREYLIDNNLRITEFLPKDSNQSIMFLQEDMGSDIPMMKVLIYIVVVIIAFVFVVLSSNNIEVDSKSIGTLKALGYKNREIVIHYMKLPIFITIVSAIIGNILGYTVLITPFKDIYYTTYSLPPLNLELNIEAFILTTIIPIIIMISINDIMLRRKLNLKTINFLRKDIRKSKNKNIKLSKKIKFKTRFKLRTIIDNIGNFVTLFFGIYLASLLLLFSIGLKPIMENYENTVKNTTVSEYQYIVNTPIDVEGYKLTQYPMKTYYKIGKRDIDVNFIGLEDTETYFNDLNLKELEEGIVISDSLSLKLNIKIGDEIKFEDKNNNKTYQFKVLDIYEYRSSFAVFVKQKDLNKMLNFPDEYFNSYFSDEKMDIDTKYIIKEISREDIGNVAKQMLNSFEEMIKLIIIFAIVIYLVLMYVLTKVIIERNSMNISLMKIIGYNSKEIKKLILRGTTITVIGLLVLVLPLEKITIDFVMQYAMARVEGYLEVVIPISVYIMVIVIGIITYLAINKFHIYKINKIPMEDALKDRE